VLNKELCLLCPLVISTAITLDSVKPDLVFLQEIPETFFENRGSAHSRGLQANGKVM
jgi:hypothetical protein